MGIETTTLRLIRGVAVGGTAEIELMETAEGQRLIRKRALSQAPAEVRVRLAREAEVLRRVQSPHLVRLLGEGPDHLLLEWIEGADLDGLAQQQRRRGEVPPVGAAWTVIREIGMGLLALHRAGWIHADLGPANVMLGQDGRVVLIDLGLARHPNDPPPKDREGTLAYQPPEQLRGQPIDGRADLYALGLIAYELLTGVLARPGGMIGAQELLEARRQRPAPPSVVRPELGTAYDELLAWALSPNPAERPAQLEEWLAKLPPGQGPGPVRALFGRGAIPLIPAASTAVASQTLVDPPAAATLLSPHPASNPAEDGSALTPTFVPTPTPVTSPTPVTTPTPATTPSPGPTPWPTGLVQPTPTPLVYTPIRSEGPGRFLPLILVAVAALLATLAFLAVQQRGPIPAPTAGPVGVRRPAEPPPAPPPTEPPPSPPPPSTVRVLLEEPPPARKTPGPRGVSGPVAPTKAPILAVEGSVIVKAGDRRGAAPFTAGPLDDQPRLLEISEGDLRVLVRIEGQTGTRRFNLGAPPGTFYQARCGDREGPTPLIGLPLGERVRCAVEAAEGRSLSFTLVLREK